MPYLPGRPSPKYFNGYNPFQQECWQAWDTAYMSHYFGYEDTRQSTPGEDQINRSNYESWKVKFHTAWEKEALRDPETRGLEEGEYTEHLMQFLYEQFKRTQGKHGK